MPTVESLPLGILIERRASVSAWRRWVWQPVGVVPQPPGQENRGHAAWRKLREQGGEAIFHAGNLPLRLYPDEAAGYLENLGRARPEIYVVLRSEGGGEPDRPVRPVLLTASPDEAGAYSEAEDAVHPLPMPPAVAAWVCRFAEEHHRPEPFVRRNRRERERREAEARQPSQGAARRRPAWEAPGE